MKSSSRAGRFKKKLVSEAQLLTEAPLIEAKMAPFHELHTRQIISDCELTALFIINVLAIRYPGNWLGSKRNPLAVTHSLHIPIKDFVFEPNINRRLDGPTLGDIFNQFALKSTPETVNRSLLSWSTGAYPLELMFRVPSPLEVLEQQKRGRRCVTVLTEAKKTKNYIMSERDTLSFTMHDLIHADHFYHNNECHQGQLALYGFLDHCIDDFTELLQNPSFLAEFEYLIADMNAYAIHSLKCLKAAIIHYGSTEQFIHWVEKFEIKDELLLLNSPSYIPEKSDAKILHWLAQYRHLVPTQRTDAVSS
jgi:hypothetical protein